MTLSLRAFGIARAGWGALLVATPGTVAGWYLGREADPASRLVTRVLGARQLGQGLVCALRPRPAVLGLGVAVDLAHGASMVALAGLDPPRRRGGLVDAGVATLLASAGWALTRRAKQQAAAAASAALQPPNLPPEPGSGR